MINKVVFIVFGMSPRIDRRIKEFVKNGFEVDVYGGRSESTKKYEGGDVYTFNAVYEAGEKYSYSQRLRDLPKLRKVVTMYNKDTTLFYFFSLNTSVLTLTLLRLNYIYEESDMLFDRFKSTFVRKIIIRINKHIIKKSLLTVFTSDGFAEFYYGNQRPSNLVVIPNRVSPDIRNYPQIAKKPVDFEHLRFGCAGNIRYQTLINVSDVIIDKFPQYEVHFYGDMMGLPNETIDHLKAQSKVFIHGSYKYPSGLSEVYNSLDFIICTYNVKATNHQYAEPNKIYEAIYFNTPMIVSSNSFLARKVEKLGIGFSVDADNKDEILKKINSITPQNYQTYLDAIKAIPKEKSLNINNDFFILLKEKLSLL